MQTRSNKGLPRPMSSLAQAVTRTADLALGCCALGAAALCWRQVRIRRRPRPAGFAVRASSLLGVSVALTSSSPAASALASPRQGAEPPWSWTSRIPSSPRLLVPARAYPPKERGRGAKHVSVLGAGAYARSEEKAHPALHGRRRSSGEPPELLFPSHTGRVPARARAAAGTPLQTYPGGPRSSDVGSLGPEAESPATQPPCAGREYRVRPGETLWSIAGSVLATTDPRRIARYWPRIHRANRALIGSTPDLIRPGWLLRLPPECD